MFLLKFTLIKTTRYSYEIKMWDNWLDSLNQMFVYIASNAVTMLQKGFEIIIAKDCTVFETLPSKPLYHQTKTPENSAKCRLPLSQLPWLLLFVAQLFFSFFASSVKIKE